MSPLACSRLVHASCRNMFDVSCRTLGHGRGRTIVYAVCLIGLLASALPAWGQGAAEQVEDRRLRRSAQTADALREAGEEAAALAPSEGGDVTWEEVLANPDDVETSFRWARKQVREGQLRGAAATLERILLLRPELASLRLLYAVVLYRLDSLSEAGRELTILADGPLTAAERAEAERYRRIVRQAARRTRVEAQLSLGSSWESNRNSAPSSGSRQVQIGDFRLELDLLPDSREQDDVAFFGLSQVRVEHDLGLHEGHALLGSFSAYLSQQLEFGDFDTRAYAFDFGGRYRGRFADVTPMLFASLVELSSETFVKSTGLDVQVERSETPRFGQRGGLRVEWQDFDAIRQSVTSNEHTGLRLEARLGATFRPATAHQLDGDFLYRMKDARGSATARTNDVFSWDGPELRLSHTWLLGGGRFLIQQVQVARESYWRADRRISTKRRRRDVRARAGVILGLPITSLLSEGRAAQALAGVVVSLGVDYDRVESNLPNYAFDDLKVSLVLSRQWSL